MEIYPFYEVDKASAFYQKGRFRPVGQEKIIFDNPSDFQGITVFQLNI